MDPITHTVVSTSLYTAMSNQPISLDNPAFIATTVGALIPDGDVVYQFFGDLPYLKQHRGASHSIVGALIQSLVTALLLSIVFATGFLYLLGFTILGIGSHLFLDYCNSYGLKLLWPLSNNKYTINLLVLIEPPLILTSLASILAFNYDYVIAAWLAMAFMLSYLLFKWLSRIRLKQFLQNVFSGNHVEKLVIVPAAKSFIHWDSIIETDESVYVGHALMFRRAYQVKEKFNKEFKNMFVRQALLSKVGQLFQDFTPHFSIKHHKTSDNKHLIEFIDLRYHMGNDFLHRAFVRFHPEGIIEESAFQPYNPQRKISVD